MTDMILINCFLVQIESGPQSGILDPRELTNGTRRRSNYADESCTAARHAGMIRTQVFLHYESGACLSRQTNLLVYAVTCRLSFCQHTHSGRGRLSGKISAPREVLRQRRPCCTMFHKTLYLNLSRVSAHTNLRQTFESQLAGRDGDFLR